MELAPKTNYPTALLSPFRQGRNVARSSLVQYGRILEFFKCSIQLVSHAITVQDIIMLQNEAEACVSYWLRQFWLVFVCVQTEISHGLNTILRSFAQVAPVVRASSSLIRLQQL